MNEHFDIIIIGTGAGGARSASAPQRQAHLVWERGRSAREKENWSYKVVQILLSE